MRWTTPLIFVFLMLFAVFYDQTGCRYPLFSTYAFDGSGSSGGSTGGDAGSGTDDGGGWGGFGDALSSAFSSFCDAVGGFFGGLFGGGESPFLFGGGDGGMGFDFGFGYTGSINLSLYDNNFSLAKSALLGDDAEISSELKNDWFGTFTNFTFSGNSPAGERSFSGIGMTYSTGSGPESFTFSSASGESKNDRNTSAYQNNMINVNPIPGAPLSVGVTLDDKGNLIGERVSVGYHTNVGGLSGGIGRSHPDEEGFEAFVFGAATIPAGATGYTLFARAGVTDDSRGALSLGAGTGINIPGVGSYVRATDIWRTEFELPRWEWERVDPAGGTYY